MKLDIYLNYRGNCEEAFHFYEQHLGGKNIWLVRHKEQQGGNQLGKDWDEKVLHGRIEIGGLTVMGADIPTAEPMRSAYLTLRLDSDEQAEKLYAILSEGGQIFMKMEKTHFASRFAMLRDKFGTSWMMMTEPQA
jgi:PhnB protein